MALPKHTKHGQGCARAVLWMTLEPRQLSFKTARNGRLSAGMWNTFLRKSQGGD